MNFFKNRVSLIMIILFLLLVLPISIYLALTKQIIFKKASSKQATINFIPTKISAKSGEEFSVEMYINSGNIPISAATIELSSENMDNNVKLIRIEPEIGEGKPFTEALEDIHDPIIPSALIAKKPTSELPKGNFKIATLVFKANKTGSGTIAPFLSETQIISGNEKGADVLLTAKQGTTTNYIISETNQQAGILKFKIKFQGIEYDNIAKDEDKTQKVRVSIIKQISDPLTNTILNTIMSKTFENIEVHAEKLANQPIAIWNGELELKDVPVGNGYSILIKGPKHLQRKFCENNPVDKAEQGFPYRCLGKGNISLTSGENILDFSNVLLFGGDLPGDKGQDGIINGYDVSLILNMIENGQSKKQEDLKVADIDLNGIVNAKERSYLIETLEEKYGDEE